MKNKSKNITAKKKNGKPESRNEQLSEELIQTMTWDEILAHTGKPISHEEMIQNLQKASRQAKPDNPNQS